MPRNWHLEHYPGEYFAIDVRTDEVVLVADTPQSFTTRSKPRDFGASPRCAPPREDEWALS